MLASVITIMRGWRTKIQWEYVFSFICYWKHLLQKIKIWFTLPISDSQNFYIYHSIFHHHSLILYPQKFILSRAPFGPISPQTFAGNLFPENMVYLPQLSNKKIRLYNFVANELQLTGTVNQSYFKKYFFDFCFVLEAAHNFFLAKNSFEALQAYFAKC